MSSVDTRRSFSSDSDSNFAETEGKLTEDFGVKMKAITFENKDDEEKEEGEEAAAAEEDEEEEEFSFVCVNTDGGSPVSPNAIFQNGEIRPVFPLFGRQLLFSDGEDSKAESSDALRPPFRKVFVEEDHYHGSESDEPEGPFCVWTGEASPEVCKKSNSTGFSKLWKFRALVPRSNSDGKDAFVFLKNPKHYTAKKTTAAAEKNSKAAVEKEEEKKKKKTAAKTVRNDGATVGTAASAHEQHYVANRKMREEDKRKSYLPYRQDIVGVFTNVSGLSRNVHPF